MFYNFQNLFENNHRPVESFGNVKVLNTTENLPEILISNK